MPYLCRIVSVTYYVSGLLSSIVTICVSCAVFIEKGKLVTWGSANDENQSYLMSGKHGEIPGHYKLPTEASVVKAAAGWAHCATVT
ncbi:ultraviolet-B receptor UVR8-like, partial [Trifolium medium]|nr:ultraviolet-B receptor UVR8-like [Trifolium medium]